jgi:hypothetical protein
LCRRLISSNPIKIGWLEIVTRFVSDLEVFVTVIECAKPNSGDPGEFGPAAQLQTGVKSSPRRGFPWVRGGRDRAVGVRRKKAATAHYWLWLSSENLIGETSLLVSEGSPGLRFVRQPGLRPRPSAGRPLGCRPPNRQRSHAISGSGNRK